jgi:hypothetical protein
VEAATPVLGSSVVCSCFVTVVQERNPKEKGSLGKPYVNKRLVGK